MYIFGMLGHYECATNFDNKNKLKTQNIWLVNVISVGNLLCILKSKFNDLQAGFWFRIQMLMGSKC